MSASPVATERQYVVLNGKCAGQIVPESDTCECDDAFDGCGGSGTVSVRFYWSGSDYANDGERECDVCGGSGRVLGWPSESWQEIQRVALHRGSCPASKGMRGLPSLRRSPRWNTALMCRRAM